MTDSQQLCKTMAQRSWMALRFIVFGIGGFWLLMICWVGVIDVGIYGERWASPFLLVPLGCAASFSMLFGVGEWRRWAYLWGVPFHCQSRFQQ